MLSDRRQLVLRALIEEYVARALPVGSRTITEHYRLGVSSATVRNDLSALESEGYITQPHTSAGRIPTDAGYRAFVDDLLASGVGLEEHPHEKVVSDLRASADALDRLIERTSVELTRLTDCLSIVTAPSASAERIRQISLISLSDFRALAVVVTEDGRVLNRQVAFPEETSADELAAIQEAIAAAFAGRSLGDVGDLPAAGPHAKTLESSKARLVLDEIALALGDGAARASSRVGMSALLRKPEFQSSSALLPLMEILEDDTVLFHALDGGRTGRDTIMVRIGRENARAELAGVSVVAGMYGRGASKGVVAVIGPTRMDYTRVIRAVKAAQDALKEE